MRVPAPPVRRLPLLLALVAALSACAPNRLTPAEGGGVAFETAAAPAEVRAAAFALARERGHPARDRDEAVEVELAGRPMSERPSRWLRVTVEARGDGSAVTVVSLPNVRRRAGVVAGRLPPQPGGAGPYARRADALDPAFDFAEALAERL